MKTNTYLTESFEELKTLLYDISYKGVIYSNLDENQKLDNLLSLNEGIFSFLFNRTKPEIQKLGDEYEQLKQDYESYKSGDSPESQQIADEISSRLESLKIQINNIKSSNDTYYPSSSDNMSVNTRQSLDTNTILPSYGQYIGNLTNTNKASIIRGSKAVGPVTDMMDKVSKLVWRKHWKTSCPNATDQRQINACKATGCDKAIYTIKMKIGICKTTVDPNGCEQTLNNLIKYWNDRKNQYLRKN